MSRRPICLAGVALVAAATLSACGDDAATSDGVAGA